jgi:hypothetical protein
MNDNDRKAIMDGTPERLKGYAEKALADPAFRAAVHRKSYVSDKAVQDFTRVCDQTGLSEKLRKD